MENRKKLTWWTTILYCLIFVAIFLGVAVLSDLITQWIPNLSLRFIIRELILRLPLSLYLMHLFAKKVIKYDNSAFYINKINKDILKWLLIGIIVSSVLLVLILICNPISYLYKGSQIDSKWLTYYIVSTIAMAINGGLIEETLFRGYIMGLLKERWNLKVAVIIPSVLFGIMHLTMLESFHIVDFSLLLIGGSLVGIMFSLIVIKTKNVFAAAIFHMAWNLLFAGRILKISNKPIQEIKSIFAFHINSDNVALNGGNFGIEVSVFAIAMYVVVSLMLIWRLKTNKS